MISKKAKFILYTLIKEGLISFELDIENLPEDFKPIFNQDTTLIKEAIIEAFNNGYVNTYDNKLSAENFIKKKSKLISLNLDKIFNDNILEGYDDYQKIKYWADSNKEEIERFSHISLFLSDLSYNGYDNTRKDIMKCLEKIRIYIEVNEGSSKDRLEMFLMWFDMLSGYLETLPDKYQYAKEYFKFEYFYNQGKNNKSNIFLSLNRNSKCPCGSGKKFKICCM